MKLNSYLFNVIYGRINVGIYNIAQQNLCSKWVYDIILSIKYRECV